ncbi:hypothetical protein JR334_02150 [Clostridia bacterium]|nr:hypothetical protein JR334_02150 [Clostridia bacterium]
MLTKSSKAQILISVLGAAWSIQLVLSELIVGDYCPKVFNIPACFLVLLAYLIVLVSIVLDHKILHALGTGLGLLLAIWFSSRQFLMIAQCPDFQGLPLCYLSLAAFALLGVLGFCKKK